MCEVLIMSDEATSPGTPLAFLNCVAPVAGAAFAPGQPGFVVAATELAALSRANAAGTAPCIGLAVQAAAVGDPVYLRYSGPVRLTTAQWDAIAGTEGGLSINSYYYVSNVAAGFLVSTAPSATGTFITAVGLAIDEETLLVGQHIATGPHA
jgi:hypothetical protein